MSEFDLKEYLVDKGWWEFETEEEENRAMGYAGFDEEEDYEEDIIEDYE